VLLWLSEAKARLQPSTRPGALRSPSFIFHYHPYIRYNITCTTEKALLNK
jgi:hypothetical protein